MPIKVKRAAEIFSRRAFLFPLMVQPFTVSRTPEAFLTVKLKLPF